MLKTHVQFRSSKFPPYPGEEDQINPNLWGKRLAEYLSDKLNEKGIRTDEIFSEDWGWIVWLKPQSKGLWIGCAHSEEHADSYVCFVEPSKGYLRRWFRKIDVTAEVTAIADTLNKILKADPEIRDVTWWKDENGLELHEE